MTKQSQFAILAGTVIAAVGAYLYFAGKSKALPNPQTNPSVWNKYKMYNNQVVYAGNSCCYYIKDGEWYDNLDWAAIISILGDPPNIARAPSGINEELPFNPGRTPYSK